MSTKQRSIPEIASQEPVMKLEKDIQRLALSYNLPLNLLLFSKYNLRINHISPNGKTYNIFAFCVMLLMNALYIYRTFILEISNKNLTFLESGLFQIFAIFYGTTVMSGFMMMFILDLVHRDNNVLLILKIQTIHRSIDFSKDIQCYIGRNWISTVAIICANIITNAVFYGSFEMLDIGVILDLVSDIMWVAVDINYVIVIRIIILLKKYLDKWIKMVLITNAEYDNDERSRKLFRMYQNILEAYNLYTKIFHVLVSPLVIQVSLLFNDPMNIVLQCAKVFN